MTLSLSFLVAEHRKYEILLNLHYLDDMQYKKSNKRFEKRVYVSLNKTSPQNPVTFLARLNAIMNVPVLYLFNPYKSKRQIRYGCLLHS